MWRVDHGLGRSLLLAETLLIHWERSLLRWTVFPPLWCASWHTSTAGVYPLVVSSVEEGWPLQIRLERGIHLCGDLTFHINSFLLLCLSTPCYFSAPKKDITKLSFIGQCKCEGLLVICIKPHHCTPALWSLSSESLSWGQSHFTSSNSVSECQIELKLEASPLRRKAQSPHSEPWLKTHRPHIHTHVHHSSTLMFFKDGASKQMKDLLILEFLVLNNATVTGTAITLSKCAPFKSLPAWFEAGYHPDKSQSTPAPPPCCCSWSMGCVWTVHPATGPHSCPPAIADPSLHAAGNIQPASKHRKHKTNLLKPFAAQPRCYSNVCSTIFTERHTHLACDLFGQIRECQRQRRD